MKIPLFAIRDKKIGFSQPFAKVNRTDAERAFISSVKASQPNICNEYPEDKQLWYLGELDDQTGRLSGEPEYLLDAIQFVNPEPVSEETKKEVPENGTSDQ